MYFDKDCKRDFIMQIANPVYKPDIPAFSTLPRNFTRNFPCRNIPELLQQKLVYVTKVSGFWMKYIEIPRYRDKLICR
jgi:hypothetical protein